MRKTKTVSEVLDLLKQQVKDGNGDLPFYVSIPYRNGIGFHTESVINISTYSGIVDMHVSMPEDDDIGRKQ